MRLFSALLVLMFVSLLPFPAFCQDTGVAALVPIEMTPETEGQILDLYCGPTQGFYRHGEQILNTGEPYVLFGQYDCWAMAAQGTKDAFGPVGWVEAGFITDIPYEPQLSFEEGFSAMIEEEAPATNDPFGSAETIAVLPQGAQITVLAGFGDWLYVQSEIDSTPVRAFIQTGTVF